MMAKESIGLNQGAAVGAAPGAAQGAAGTSIAESLAQIGRTAKGPPPVHLWNPPFCGDIDMRIARDGTWFYNGTPIGRPALVKLFASVLRRDTDRYVLVTPVEKVGIVVEDAPFLAVELVEAAAASAGSAPLLRLRTTVDDWVTLDREHPLRFEPGPADALKPYVLVRDALWALVVRPVFYELVGRGETRDVDGVATFGIASGQAFFPMMAAADLAAAGEEYGLG